MTSEERHAARRQRRQAKRTAKRIAREEKYGDFDKVFNYRNMYKAYLDIRKGVMWKASVQRYANCPSIQIQRTLGRLRRGTYRSGGFHCFTINERGKQRDIRAVNTEERNIQRCLCDHCLVPLLENSFVYDNSATRKGKGYHFAIKRLRRYLTRHIRRYGVSGYILIYDFKNFFGSIPHDLVKSIVDKKIPDERLKTLIYHLIDCFGDVGLGLGSQISQILSLSVGDLFDHIIAEKCQMGSHARYMDDGYIIHESKEALQECLKVLYETAEMFGLKLNSKKTFIIPIKHGFTILKKRFSFAKTGKIIMKICRESVTHERRRLKKLRKKVDEGKMTFQEIYPSLQSWRSYAKFGNNHRTIRNMEMYYQNLVFGAT